MAWQYHVTIVSQFQLNTFYFEGCHSSNTRRSALIYKIFTLARPSFPVLQLRFDF